MRLRSLIPRLSSSVRSLLLSRPNSLHLSMAERTVFTPAITGGRPATPQNPSGSSSVRTLSPLARDTPLAPGDDAFVAGPLRYKGEDLMGSRAKVVQWDPDHEVWVLRLGASGELVGARPEKLWKIRQVTLDELDRGSWFVVKGSERSPPEVTSNGLPETVPEPLSGAESALLIDLPKGVEVKLDLETGRKLVRRAKEREL